MGTGYKMCLFPINAELQEFGRPKFTPEGALKLPCGKCTECRSARAVEWAIRAKHEIALHDENSFLTLTYNNESLPSNFIDRDPFQKFMKRLRKHTKSPLRYMVSHEYGSKTKRPHHHAIIFGWNPKGQYEPTRTKSGETIFRSPELEKLWTHGNSSVGTANERTAYYIASYALKGAKHEIQLPTGEIEIVNDKFDCSRRPAIGLNYLIKNQTYLTSSETPLPRYYAKLLKEASELHENYNRTPQQQKRFEKLKDINPTLHEHYENHRMLKFKTRSHHEVYAKYILDQQKIITSLNEFRSTENSPKDENYYKENLKQSRDEEQFIIKKRST